MYCPRCGTQNDDNAFRCIKCNEVIQFVQAPASRRIEDDAAMRLILPVGRSGLAIAAGYAGLFACIPFLAPIALILGILAIRDIKQHRERRGMGRAVFGLVMGVLGTAVVLFFLVAIILGN